MSDDPCSGIFRSDSLAIPGADKSGTSVATASIEALSLTRSHSIQTCGLEEADLVFYHPKMPPFQFQVYLMGRGMFHRLR